jgi:crotonobetainyl-CoA:carnitine CoA-transferase CaiB-like acyl-CoA transferase
MALLARQRTGRGQLVDVGMLDATTALLTYQAAICFATGAPPRRLGNRHPTIVPYETFAAADGDIVVAVGNDDQWRRFCAVADLGEMGRDSRFATNRLRVENYEVLRPLVSERLRARRRDEWLEDFRAAGVPCGAVRDVREALGDPQLAEREMVTSVEHPTLGALQVLGIPIKLSETPGAVRTAPPTLGQHTDAILRDDLGLSAAAVSRLRSERTI